MPSNKFTDFDARKAKTSWYFTGENQSYVGQGWNREYKLVDDYFDTDPNDVINDLKLTKEE